MITLNLLANLKTFFGMANPSYGNHIIGEEDGRKK